MLRREPYNFTSSLLKDSGARSGSFVCGLFFKNLQPIGVGAVVLGGLVEGVVDLKLGD